MPSHPDILSRLPWFEELHARAEHVLADRHRLAAERRAALGELDRTRDRTRGLLFLIHRLAAECREVADCLHLTQRLVAPPGWYEGNPPATPERMDPKTCRRVALLQDAAVQSRRLGAAARASGDLEPFTFLLAWPQDFARFAAAEDDTSRPGS
jgi:hypothetical protein